MSTEPEKTPEKLTAGTLRTMIGEMVAEAVKTLTPGTETKEKEQEKPKETGSTSGSIRDAVAREVGRLRDKDAAAERDRSIDTQLAELAEKTKEKQPIERRRVHRFMGWGDNE